MKRTFRYRLYPTRQQIAALDEQLDFNCALYNAALEQRRWAYRQWGVSVHRNQQARELTEIRQAGLAPDGNQWTQASVLTQLDRAFVAFFRRLRNGERPGFPRYRSRSRYGTLGWSFRHGGAQIVDGRLRLQGVGHVKVKWHRQIPSEADFRQLRVTCRNGRWYAAFMIDLPESDPLMQTGDAVGLDLGVRTFVALSNGELHAGPRSQRAASPQVRRAARRLSRRQRGSHRRRKAAALLARQREREANRRQDAAHKLSRELVNRFDLIAHEDLRISNMVHANRGLSREIHDQGWAQFLHFLTYKAESAGRQVVAVSPLNTSRTCAECGTIDGRSRYGAHFNCVACGHSDNADVNAARNILARTEPSGANETVVSLPEKPLLRSRYRSALMAKSCSDLGEEGEGNGP